MSRENVKQSYRISTTLNERDISVQGIQNRREMQAVKPRLIGRIAAKYGLPPRAAR
jgi:hypothetical protein